MKILATIYQVTLQWDWQDEDETSTYSCGSLAGAHKFIAQKVEKGDVLWYSIEENSYIPCKKDDPEGQLYIGCDYMEFHDCRKEGTYVAKEMR